MDFGQKDFPKAPDAGSPVDAERKDAPRRGKGHVRKGKPSAKRLAPGAPEIVRDYDSLTAHFAAHGYPPPHPLACIFPPAEGFGDSINAAKDLLSRVFVRKEAGQIIDGIERCLRLIERDIPWAQVPKQLLSLPTDKDVADCIAKCNLERRHLDKSQTAMLAVQLGLADAQQGVRTDLGKNCRKLIGVVSGKYLQYGRTVRDQGIPELARAVMSREITIGEAAMFASEVPKSTQAATYKRTRTGARSLKTEAGNAICAARAKALSEQCTSLPTLKASVVYVDAPLGTVGESPFNPRDIVSHYPIMPDADVEALIRLVLAPNAWIFAWTSVPFRRRTEVIMENVGGLFIGEMVWSKAGCRGLGRVVRLCHEVLLIYRVGNPPLPPTNAVPDSVVTAEVAEHSRKSNVFRDIIVAMTPNLEPRLELFARGAPYPGFIAWGNQVIPPVNKTDAEDAVSINAVAA